MDNDHFEKMFAVISENHHQSVHYVNENKSLKVCAS